MAVPAGAGDDVAPGGWASCRGQRGEHSVPTRRRRDEAAPEPRPSRPASAAALSETAVTPARGQPASRACAAKSRAVRGEKSATTAGPPAASSVAASPLIGCGAWS